MTNEPALRLSGDAVDMSVLDNLAAESKAVVSEALNAALKERIAAALAESRHPNVGEFVAALGPVDIRANKDTPVRALLIEHVRETAKADPETQAALDAALAGFPDRTTLGELLSLDLPIREHPLFRDAAHKAALDAILSTAPALADNPSLRDEFIDLYAGQAGPPDRFWEGLAERPGFDDPAVIKEIQTALELELLTKNNPGMVRLIRVKLAVESLRDLTQLDSADWKDMISQGVEVGTLTLPSAISGVSAAERIDNYAASIMEQLRAAFPTAYVAKGVAKGPDIDLALVQEVLRRNPDLDILVHPDAINWGEMSVEDKARAMTALQDLQRESRMFPGFDYRAALAVRAPRAMTLSGSDEKDTALPRNPLRQAVAQFFAKAPDFDFRTTQIDSFAAQHAETAFRDIDDREAVTTQLKGMQRIFQVAPTYQAMSTLMGEGLDSAHKIANIPQPTFVQQFQEQLGGEIAARNTHARAEFVTAATAQLYTQIAQALNDVQPRALAMASNGIKKYPNLATLFGQVNLCDCPDCRSVYSPAAYFVDLLHMLKNSTTGGTSLLDVLLERRPDLEYIKLTCENTNTAMPYVDLVNEILESYVLLGKLDQSVAKDTGESTTEELNAEPQYTNSAAYDSLKQAVFPMSLPFDLPVAVARAYLEQLGSSRYELMETFRRNVTRSALDRASEYLLLSPGERDIILDQTTKPTSNFYGYDAWEAIWIEDNLPAGASPSVQNDTWTWITAQPAPFSGQKAHQSTLAAGLHQHFFTGATPGMSVAVDDQLFAYVFLDPNNPPQEVMLQWNDGSREHRAYWGANLIERGTNGTASRQFMGVLPPTGRWVRLEVPARDVDLEGETITGMAFALFDGRATWDHTGKRGAVENVTVFLDRTDLQFTDLIELLKTRFVNPSRRITLDTPVDGEPCSLDQTTIKNLDESVLRKIQRFIRLWRKLGGTMQELDKILTALQAADITSDVLQKLAQIKQLQSTLRLPLVQLLSLWANIDTQGDDTLYKTVFLNKTVLNLNDPNDNSKDFLPNQDGSVLTDVTKTISGHVLPLLAALRISATDLALIRANARLEAKKAPLTLANVSVLYRYAVLARAVKLSITDLIGLKTLAGTTLEPFGTPNHTNQFVQLVQKVQQSGFSVAQLNYLYRHMFDATGNIAPGGENVLQLVTSLHNGLGQIAATYAMADDPTGDLTRVRLGELFGSTTVDQVIRMIDGSATYTARFESSTAITFPAALAGRIVYDGDAKLLRLTGPLSTSEHDTLLANVMPANLRTDPAYQAAIANLFQQPRSFITDTCSAFLNVTDAVAKLLDNQPAAAGQPPLTTEGKFHYVLEALSAYLQANRSYTLVKQTLSNALKLDLAMVELLLQRLNNKQISADCVALSMSGISATYFSDAQLATPASTRIDPAVAFDGQGAAGATTIPVSTGSARWTGVLLPPTTGTYRFYVRTNGAARLWVGDTARPIIDAGIDQATAEAPSDPADLKAGRLYQLRLEVRQMGAPGIAQLRWSADSMPKALVPSTSLYPQTLVDAFARSFTLLHKIALIVNGFKLTPNEVAYLLDHAADFAGFDLQSLPLERSNAAQTDQRAVALFKQWQRLLDVVALRNSLPVGETALIDVFGAAAFAAGLAAADPRKQSAVLDTRQKLVRATGWDAATVDALRGTAEFNLSVDVFKNEIWLIRLQAAIHLIQRLGIAAPQLFQWATAAPDAAQAQDIKRTVKAKYDEETWLTIAKSLNDGLRERQRDALVAYLLPRLGLNDSARLFELFLIDVDMSACMPTSRIKQAIASVQLFVQRCLMNLEPAVSPLAIDTGLWQWMKRYRTWEANRKVFLYPENWIEPELRDDKSPFFKELQTELLQTDLTPDAAETVFLHYLEKLDQVARLEICGMYWQIETGQTGNTADLLHVFGRTLSTPQIYYYRRLENRVNWTPWERVSLDISGDHLIPVIFNRRLYLFWPIFTQKVQTILKVPQNQESVQPTKYWEISLAWSEYKQGKWLPKQVSTGLKGFLSTNLSANNISLAPEDLDRRQYVFKTVIEPDSQTVMIKCQRAKPDKIVTTNGSAVEAFAEVGEFVLDPYGGITAQDVTRGNADDNLHPSLIPPGSVADAMMFTNTNRNVSLLLNSDANSASVRILTNARYHSILPPHQFGWTDFTFTLKDKAPYAFQPFFYQDDRHTYFVLPESVQEQFGLKVETRFATHYHPYVWRFIRSLNTRGIPNLLALDNQRSTDQGFVFYNQYKPTYRVPLPYPEEDVDFDYGGAYALYNWELFFHTPMLIATRLSKNQQWEEAQKWFHYIFDPTNPDPSPIPLGRTEEEWARERYWKVLPFQLYEWDQIASLLDALSYTGNDPEELAYKQQVVEQINQWMHDPFNPHRIARLRQIAYQKHVLMKYIDNLIGWGDYLFRQYTPETVQEATQLYVLAAELLGPRPQRIPARGTTKPESYNTLKDKLDDFSNALVELENQFPFSTAIPVTNGTPGATANVNIARTAYFGIPQNEKLLGYWDTVADRLFKIRYCMNIEGVIQQLPLFAPPIDPGLLTQAAAAGINLDSVLGDINAPVPCYRFQYTLQKAQELCNDLKSLGGALLSVLEKRDAEALSLLRSTHEINVLNATRMVKVQQIEENKQTLEGLRKTRLVTQARYDYYSTIPQRIDYETEQIEQLGVAQDWQIAAQVTDIAASVAHMIPDFDVGVSGSFGSPVAKLRYGGQNIGNSLQAASRVLSFIASLHSHQANMASIQGGWKRRSDEWALQAQLAQKELDQIDKQVLAAQIRQAIAEQELRNHDLQIENAKAVDDFMHRKYTNQELFEWMMSQIATIYFQTYQLAYDLAKRAEKTYRFERGVTTSNFIQFGYWDNLHKGLLVGEQLSLALRQMESAYMEQNKREYEITKHISLMLHDPLALIALKETGQCQVSLSEALFDVDYPGHYMRRIRSVSLTIPAVIGPYTSINGTLTLLSNKIRVSSNAVADYREQDNDQRFIANFASVQSIATSHAQNDSGLFELNFRDERYLPFEGAGAVSEWRIDLPKECNAFDFETISDVIIRLSYTAREGGDALRRKAWSAATFPEPRPQRLPAALGPLPQQDDLVRMYSAKHEFPNEWYRFLNPPGAASGQSLAFALTKERFPFQFRSRDIQIHRVELFWKFKTEQSTQTYREQGAALAISLASPDGASANGALVSLASFFNGVPHAVIEVGDAELGTWMLTAADGDITSIASTLRHSVTANGVTHQRLNAAAIEDLLIVCHYSLG